MATIKDVREAMVLARDSAGKAASDAGEARINADGALVSIKDALTLIDSLGTTPTTVPTLSLLNDSINSPILTGEAGQSRGWFLPSVIEPRSHRHYYSPCDDSDGRHLYHKADLTGTQSIVKRHVENVVVHDATNMTGIRKLSNGSTKLFQGFGSSQDGGKTINWTFSDSATPDTGWLSFGDIHAATKQAVWMKGHDWKRDSNGKTVEYFRRWFLNGKLVVVNYPQPANGQRYETYAMAIMQPAGWGWKSKTRYVALISAFRITDAQATAWQHGPIDLLWATSDDGLTWQLPWGDTPAIDRGAAGMLFAATNPFVSNGELIVHLGVSHFEHNGFRRGAGQVVGTGLSTLPQADFERHFG